MKIIAITFRLHAPWVHSLKEKRMIVKSLLTKLQSRFHISAAEIDEQNTHQIIVIGIAAIVPHNAMADSLMDEISAFIDEIHALGIGGLVVDDLNLLTGAYVNLAYPLSNGTTVKFLNDKDIYLGNQIEKQDSERCYGVVADERFILVCEYGCNGADPEIVLYKRR